MVLGVRISNMVVLVIAAVVVFFSALIVVECVVYITESQLAKMLRSTRSVILMDRKDNKENE